MAQAAKLVARARRNAIERGEAARSSGKARGARPKKGAGRSPWPLRLSLVYLALVAGIWLLTRTLAERLWWTHLLLYLPQAVYAAPALLLLPLALHKRDGRALLATFAATLLVAGPLMGLVLPIPAPAGAPSKERVRILAYNIRGGVDGFEHISRQIKTFRPDVVVFSEARGWGRERKLREELERQFPEWSDVQAGDVYIASRWPIVDEDSERLGASGEREKVRAVVQAPFGRFHVVGVHFHTAVRGETLVNQRRRLPGYLRSTARVRREQARDLLDWTRDLDEPVIVAGDFNTPPAGTIYGSLTEEFEDAFAKAGTGWGYTFPSRLPVLRIDYVFHSRHWQATAARVGEAPGSDHRPVFAELALRPRESDRQRESRE